jgi:hypothetical protein
MSFRSKSLNAVPSTDGEMAGLALLLNLPAWSCDERGPRFPIDESLTDEAISGFVLISEGIE